MLLELPDASAFRPRTEQPKEKTPGVARAQSAEEAYSLSTQTKNRQRSASQFSSFSHSMN
jgi:hypothetical protein